MEVTNRSVIVAERVVAFERTPDFYTWPRAVFPSFRYVGAFAGNEMIGYVLVSVCDAWLAGRATQSAYIGDARVLPEWRGQGVLRGAMAFLQPTLAPSIETAMFVVRRGNRAMTAVAARFARGWPMARLADVTVCDVSVPNSDRSLCQYSAARSAVAEDASAIAGLLNERNRQTFLAERVSATSIAASLAARNAHCDGLYLVSEDDTGLAAVVCLRDAPPGRKVRFATAKPKASIFERLRGAQQRGSLAPPPATGCISHFAYRPDASHAGRDLLAYAIGAAAGKGHSRLRLVSNGSADDMRRAIPVLSEETTVLTAFGVFRDRATAARSRGQLGSVNSLAL